MIAPRIDYSTKEERLDYIRERFHCKAPACGGCGSAGCLTADPQWKFSKTILKERSSS